MSPTILNLRPIPLPRRALLGGAAGMLLATRHARAASAGFPASTGFPEGATLLVAGPEDGRLDQWAASLIPALAHGLPAAMTLRREIAGGVDGVTGCNQFEARVAPDGATVLLLPGAAALAWLAGDPRAKFDAARFVPVLAGVTPGVLLSRRPLNAIAAGPLSVAAQRPDSASLAGLLALDLLGVAVRPVYGLGGAAAESALASKAVDALLLTGQDAAARAEVLSQNGVRPVLSFGAPGNDGTLQRDPLFPAVPALRELLSGNAAEGMRYEAWRAVASAAQLEFLMVLQSPTPAALVALWRQAAAQAAPLVLPPAGSNSLRVLPCPAINRFAAPLAADTATLFELRRWMAERLNWQPA